ncbi:MAG: hypothetical protein IPK07_35675 [Deltaproteobacteria bacterium]|nr:hypothetical protein [Deltaproteobacteria bacterium]
MSGRACVLLGAALLVASCAAEDGEPRAIPRWLFAPREIWALVSPPSGDAPSPARPGGQLERFAAVDFAKPVRAVAPQQHPFMAANPGSNMHDDASMTDTYAAPGPFGVSPEVRSRSRGFGGYGTVTFDRARRMVGVYGNGRGFELQLLDPFTLRKLAGFALPPRPWSFPLEGVAPWKYIGAGMYFYLDDRDRAVVPTTENTIEVLQVPADPARGFTRVRSYDLSDVVVEQPWPKRDSVAFVLPEWSGRRYWYATTLGRIGTVEVETGHVESVRFGDEIVENSFAVGEDGIFVATDRALYRLSADAAGAVVTDWRSEYDRGPAAKAGMITRGTGTSVSLVGGRDGLVVLTDNAEPRIHVLFVRRADGALACSEPLFAEGRSATDISAVEYEHADETACPPGATPRSSRTTGDTTRSPSRTPSPGSRGWTPFASPTAPSAASPCGPTRFEASTSPRRRSARGSSTRTSAGPTTTP